MNASDAIALDFVFRTINCRDRNVFVRDLKSTIGSMGFDYSVITRVPVAGDLLRPNLLHLDFPASWVTHYADQKYVATDPIIRQMRFAGDPKVWSEVPVEKRSRAWCMMREAAEHGLRDGVSVPVVTGRGTRSHATFVTSAREFDRNVISALTLVGIFAHYTIQSIIAEEAGSGLMQNYSARELDCLKWLSEGKSQTDIGSILSISPNTVKFHLRSVAAKLGVRAVERQLVVEAFRRSLID